jgi:tRNA nucleotidyltransferase (CCA-adding enzyme)
MSEENKIEVLLVGGAVRDKLLGLEVHDLDYLVLGGTPEHFLKLGYEYVGKDFPVFLHPITKDEYALARTERKIGVGYGGFETTFDPSVTVEEDLFRRDLTINAIAQRENGELVDPYGGVDDLKNKVLRHVSDHFSEDPVRVLRIARFMSRYAHLGFTIHEDTMKLMKEMVANGELNHLTSERVFKEMEKTFLEPEPSKFFETLRECGALEVVFPEINDLFGVPQPAQYHPEIDTGIHTLMTLDQAAKITKQDKEELDVMYAALVHDLGKAVTHKENLDKIDEAQLKGEPLLDSKKQEIEPEVLLTKHLMHEVKGVPLVTEVSKRLKVPNHYKSLSLTVCEHHTKMHNALKLSNQALYGLYKSIGAFRSDSVIRKFGNACEADAKGRTGLENVPYPQTEYLEHCFSFIKDNNSQVYIDKGIKGKELGKAIEEGRIALLAKAKALYKPNVLTRVNEWEHLLKDTKKGTNNEILRCIKALTVAKNTELLDSVLMHAELQDDGFKTLAYNVVNIDVQKFLDSGLKNIEIGLAIKEESNELINAFKNPKIKKRLKP